MQSNPPCKDCICFIMCKQKYIVDFGLIKYLNTYGIINSCKNLSEWYKSKHDKNKLYSLFYARSII